MHNSNMQHAARLRTVAVISNVLNFIFTIEMTLK